MPTDITWKNITVKLGDLQPWQRNPRKSSKRQAEKMLESWDKFGQVQTVAIGPGMEVYDGHQRLSALLTYGKQVVLLFLMAYFVFVSYVFGVANIGSTAPATYFHVAVTYAWLWWLERRRNG